MRFNAHIVIVEDCSVGDKSGACWAVSAMRFRTLWEWDGNEAVVVCDVHDNINTFFKELDALYAQLNAEGKEIGGCRFWFHRCLCQNEFVQTFCMLTFLFIGCACRIHSLDNSILILFFAKPILMFPRPHILARNHGQGGMCILVTAQNSCPH
jgi:hypothetical protein